MKTLMQCEPSHLLRRRQPSPLPLWMGWMGVWMDGEVGKGSLLRSMCLPVSGPVSQIPPSTCLPTPPDHPTQPGPLRPCRRDIIITATANQRERVRRGRRAAHVERNRSTIGQYTELGRFHAEPPFAPPPFAPALTTPSHPPHRCTPARKSPLLLQPWGMENRRVIYRDPPLLQGGMTRHEHTGC